VWPTESTRINRQADQGTCEPFYSEFKTDRDRAHLPSHTFAAHALVVTGAQLA
jgi:hypothetical protein